MEVVVKVININEGRNKEIAARCRMLAEYSAFVARVRAFEREKGDKEASMKEAIKYCREHGILSKFLELHSAEVFNMLITEWNTEDAKEVWYEEGLEDGREEARKEKLLTASNLKKLGVSIEIIARATGLSAGEIEGL